MKRYFKNEKERQVMMIEFAANSILKKQSVSELFENSSDITEINKAEYLKAKYAYEKENETNLVLTITR